MLFPLVNIYALEVISITSKVKRLTSDTLVLFLSVSLFILFCTNHNAASSAMTASLHLCADKIIPSLFPFMVLSELFVSQRRVAVRGGAERICDRAMRCLLGTSAACVAPFVLACISGAPIGARLSLALYKNGCTDKQESESLLGLCGCPSLAFVVYAIGGGMLKSISVGVRLYISLLVSTLLSGVIISRLTDANNSSSSSGVPLFVCSKSTPPAFSSQISSAVRTGAMSVFYICAFVAFFSTLCSSLTASLTALLPPSYASGPCAFICICLELTSGAASAVATGGLWGVLLLCVALGWGGLCVHFQIISLVSAEGSSLSVKKYIFSRLLSALLCPAVFYLLYKLKPLPLPSLPVASPSLPQVTQASPSAPLCVIFSLAIIFYFVKKLDIGRSF